ncbi:MAG: hypothetical protein ACYCOU_14075 [Sulfobacillus sp.]
MDDRRPKVSWIQDWFKLLAAPVPWSRASIARWRIAGVVVLFMLLVSYGLLWEALRGELILVWVALGELLALAVMGSVFLWAIAGRRRDVNDYRH